jgi:glucose dehydrogenase
VSQGRAYTLFAEGVDEFAVCLDALTGTEVWRVRIDAKFEESRGSGPRSTPTVVDGVVYALRARGRLYALDAERGDVLWRRELRKLFGGELQSWGHSTSPLVVADLLIVQAGGDAGKAIAALHRATGEVAWTSFSDQAGYSSPILVTAAGVEQVVCLTAQHLVSVAPENGTVLWQVPFEGAINIANPVQVSMDRIFVSAAYDKGAALVKVIGTQDGLTAAQEWTSRGMKNWINSSVVLGDYLYGFDSSMLKCIAVDTGEMQWRQRGFGRGSLILADGHLLVLGEDGALAVVEATPLEYREKSRFQAFDSKCWTAPSLADGKLYLRDESEVICLDLAPPAGT